MRGERINTSLIPFISIKSCKIDKCVNKHGYAEIIGFIKEDEKVLENISELTITTIWVEDENKNRRNLFTGIVDSLSVYEDKGGRMCQLCVIGITKLMDIDKKTRTFQNTSLEYYDILQILNKKSGAAISGVEHLHKLADTLYVQYKETDWEFLLRIVSNIHKCVIPDYSLNRVHYCVGIPNYGQKFIFENVEHEKSKEFHFTNNYFENPLDNNETKEVIEFVNREILELGAQVNTNTGSFYVYKIESYLEKSEITHKYQLRRKSQFHTKQLSNFMIVGASLDAEIIDVERDRVKVKVYVDEVQDKNTAWWFPYSSVFSSPDGTGWYCMPEVGDKVRLYFPNEKESDAYIISSVHVDCSGNSQDRRTNPDNKSIMNKYNKKVELTPTTIILTNEKGMSVVIDDKEGITIESDKNITFKAKENFEMISIENSVEIVASKEIDLVQNGAAIKMDGNITMTGGQIHAQN